MPTKLEIGLKKNLFDSEGNSVKEKAKRYFDIEIDKIRVIKTLLLDVNLNKSQLAKIQNELFTNPVTEISSYKTLNIPFAWTILLFFRAGVKDNAGGTAKEAIEDILNIKFKKGEAVYTSKRYCIEAENLKIGDVDKIASELLANDIIQISQIFNKKEWEKNKAKIFIPKVKISHKPTVDLIEIKTDEALQKISDEKNLALNPNDIPVIRKYFLDKNVIKKRKKVGLTLPTDIEIEYISQARSDHCNHNTFGGLFYYEDLKKTVKENNLFEKYIKNPTLELKKKKNWVKSVLWDNAGVAKFDEKHNYTITGETHNSPSNMEAYGGAITGIVGVYRDPLGTGLSSKLVMGSYGYCVGDINYNGDLKPPLHPRRLLDGIIEGVKDGGNKSGVPTTFGQVIFENGYMGKALVFVIAIGIMPSKIKGELSFNKKTESGDLIIMSGGRVGKDGIHGVTASSETLSKNTPAGHVQIGDPYTQKKMHDFILEARDKGLISFITDNGGGGLSSSVGESSMIAGGSIIAIDKVPLKYDGLNPWEIWISESQERMTIGIKEKNLDEFMHLSKKHSVESTVIGSYTNSGFIHIKYKNETIAYIDIDLLSKKFPQWEFEAKWMSPKSRALIEPVFSVPKNYNKLLCDILSMPNIASKRWISKQYDHEVQGGSVIKPIVGENRDMPSDASVIRPILNSKKGLAFASALLPFYSKIDAYHMTTCTIDEAVRRLISVGGSLKHIGGIDNFCWPSIQYDEIKNPDGKFKAAQLVRSARALKDAIFEYGIPLLSGKDSMYADGHLFGKYGETQKISALETLQFSAVALIDNIEKCISMDIKDENDLIYIVGLTKDECGGSAYYDFFGYTGLNVPKVDFKTSVKTYKKISSAIQKKVIKSCHGIYYGGLATHLALISMGGNLGIEVDISKVPKEKSLQRIDKILFSESVGRFLVTVAPKNKKVFEKILSKTDFAQIGSVKKRGENFLIRDSKKASIISIPIKSLKNSFDKTFKDFI